MKQHRIVDALVKKVVLNNPDMDRQCMLRLVFDGKVFASELPRIFQHTPDLMDEEKRNLLDNLAITEQLAEKILKHNPNLSEHDKNLLLQKRKIYDRTLSHILKTILTLTKEDKHLLHQNVTPIGLRGPHRGFPDWHPEEIAQRQKMQHSIGVLQRKIRSISHNNDKGEQIDQDIP